ncbi:von Willebrand factor type A domain protein [Phycisphaerae bacterium RAS1]|nr:von Willebrand factor type A domain protein [Phycisphaerae bacterium RAS1]
MTRLAYPFVLLFLLLIPLLWFLWLRRARRPVIRFSDLAAVRAAAGAWPGRVRLILPVLRSAALACLIVAAARPQRSDESSKVFAEGIAIQMTVDISSSMNDLDLAPRGAQLTRLDVVKDVFKRFVKGDGDLPGRPNDLIGMVRFARFADSVCPLTLDHASLLAVLESTQTIQPQRRQEEDGTAIGDGLALAVERLKDLKRTSGSGEQHVIRSRIVILLTDGENNMGNVEPQQAGDLAANYGIKVYTILAGTGQQQGPFRRPVDSRDLRAIADVTGGKFFHATNRESLRKIYEEIDKLERTKVEERRFVRWEERSQAWLIAAFACVCFQVLLDATRLRKVP